MCITLVLKPRIQEHITDQTKERLENKTVGDMRKLVSERVAKGKSHILAHIDVTTATTGMMPLQGTRWYFTSPQP